MEQMMGNKPTVWLVLGDKLGDNAQVEVVAESLDWPTERKRLVFKEPYVIGKPRFKPSLYHVDLQRSDPLVPPWPDLVITIGRRPSMAALWIKQQSGGKTKVVLFGRPRRYAKQFDLIVVPPQHFMPAGANVHQLELPLMRVSKEKIAREAGKWKEKLSKLERPLVGVFVGGVTKVYSYDEKVGRDLMDKVYKSIGGRGTIYITTSRRTPKNMVKVLDEFKPDNALLYRWGIDESKDNPYQALLAHADGCVVTSDSISMMVEVMRLRKPLAVFNLPMTLTWPDKIRLKLGKYISRKLVSAWIYNVGIYFGGRDMESFYSKIINKGWGVEIDQNSFPYKINNVNVPDEVEMVVQKITQILQPFNKCG